MQLHLWIQQEKFSSLPIDEMKRAGMQAHKLGGEDNELSRERESERKKKIVYERLRAQSRARASEMYVEWGEE